MTRSFGRRPGAPPPALKHNPCALLADDVTGACDAGAPFAERGCATNVWFAGQHHSAARGAVNVFCTASRHDSPDAAARKVRQVAAAQAPSPIIFKKIDSTLLGNIGAEIEALMDARRDGLALVAPAFPAMGRVIVGGHLHVGGRDPAARRHLPTLLREQGAMSTAHIGLDAVRAGAASVGGHVAKLIERGVRVISFDGESQEDLRQVALTARRLSRAPLLVGSGALAAEVASSFEARTAGCLSPESDPARGPVIFIVGSVNPVTQRQVDCLFASEQVASVRPGERIPASALRRQTHVLVRVDPRGNAENSFAEVVALAKSAAWCGIFLAGGETAEMVANRWLGARGINLKGEIVPGLPWGRLIGGKASGLPVVTKAGGFGAEDALLEVTDFFRRAPAAKRTGAGGAALPVTPGAEEQNQVAPHVKLGCDRTAV